MRYKQQVIKEMGIIETTLITGITAQELRMSINQAYQLSAEWGIHRFLVDASAAISHISLLTYFELPKVFMSLNLPRSSRIAVLSSRSQKGKERARFFENVCRNRGWQVKMFYHRLEALEWLGSEIGQL